MHHRIKTVVYYFLLCRNLISNCCYVRSRCSFKTLYILIQLRYASRLIVRCIHQITQYSKSKLHLRFVQIIFLRELLKTFLKHSFNLHLKRCQIIHLTLQLLFKLLTLYAFIWFYNPIIEELLQPVAMKDSSFKKSNLFTTHISHSNKQNGIAKIRERLLIKKQEIESMSKLISHQIQISKNQQTEKNRLKKLKFHPKQKKVDIIPQKLRQDNEHVENDEMPYYKPRDTFTTEREFKITILSSAIFYPPACASFDLAYCKSSDKVYAYGGISCTSQLKQGIRQYFYQLQEQAWKQLKPTSMFTPVPRYGHTLTGTNDSLLLFGGVSEYKQKLKDRCFYSDVWAFNVITNSWRIMQFSGTMIKNRKSHAASVHNKFYIVSGGIDDSEEIINEISWVNIQQKKGKWKSKKMEGRFNHQITICQSKQGMDYLFMFGGRNSQSEIISELTIYPIYISEGELHLKQPIKVCPELSPCEFPILRTLQNGVVIVGGIDMNNQAVNQCWYFQMDSFSLQAIESKIDWKELRGAKGASLAGKSIYILSGSNSKKYKGIKIGIEQTHDDQLSFFKY